MSAKSQSFHVYRFFCTRFSRSTSTFASIYSHFKYICPYTDFCRTRIMPQYWWPNIFPILSISCLTDLYFPLLGLVITKTYLCILIWFWFLSLGRLVGRSRPREVSSIYSNMYLINKSLSFVKSWSFRFSPWPKHLWNSKPLGQSAYVCFIKNKTCRNKVYYVLERSLVHTFKSLSISVSKNYKDR